MRRTRPKENPEPDGPQIEQISNAYWFKLPKAIAMVVRQLLIKGAKPADQEHREQEDARRVQEMIASLSAEDQARLHAGDISPLALALRDAARAIDARASASSSSAILPGREFPGREG